jgi:hypothetical protein
MNEGHAYPSPQAFRQALTDKLREAAKSSPWTLSQLQRQMTYDRLLERLYLVDDGWVVKGATALLARGIGVRGTIDVDIYARVPGRIRSSITSRHRAVGPEAWPLDRLILR